MGLSPVTTSSTVLDNQSWKHDGKFAGERSLTIDGDSVRARFPAGTDIPSGVVLAKAALNPIGALYAGTSDEVQTLTEGGSGLTSFTISYAGQTTASLDDDATAAQVQAALEALSNIAPGDVTVTGGPLATGPFTLTFGGTLADTNVAAVTTTPTGGTGTVVVATATAGGTDLADTAIGFLSWGQTVPATDDLHCVVYEAGPVKESELPALSGLDTAAKTDLTHIRFHS